MGGLNPRRLGSPGEILQAVNFEEVLERIVEKDRRYDREAFTFLREALDYTQKSLSKSRKAQVGHISGAELLQGFRDYALANFGPMTLTVLEEWGIRNCEDIGNMVFLMVENGLLRKTEKDSPEDFRKGYDFDEAFRKPFLPSTGAGATLPAGKGAEVEKN